MQVTLDALESAALDWFVRLTPRRTMSRDEYRSFVASNPELRIERTAQGEVMIMAPAHSRTGRQNMEIARQVANWALEDGGGAAFDSSTGFDLPDGSNRSPGVSWVQHRRLEALSQDELQAYYPICPDFVVVLRSDSDRLPQLQEKMREYIANGAVLGWLVDPIEQKVHVYRQHEPVEMLARPESVKGESSLAGLEVRFAKIWQLR